MKESFQRLVEWAKEHPWITALILGGVALLAYLTYKNGWFGMGGGSSASTVPDSSTIASGADTSGGGSASTVPDSSTVASGADTSGGGTTPTDAGSSLGSVIAPPPTPTYTGSEQGAGAGLAGIGSIPSSNLDNLFGAPVSVAPPASNNSLAGGAPLASMNLSGFSSGGLAQPQVTPAPTKNKTNANMTPAQLVGKGKRFTGTYQGVTYQNGYPVGSLFSRFLGYGTQAFSAPFVQAPASQVKNTNTATAPALKGAVGSVGTSTVVISKNTATTSLLSGAVGNAGGR